MVGFGAGFKLTDSASATLELENYGKTTSDSTSLVQARLQAGVQIGF